MADIIRPFDLPITKGLQQCIRAFDEIDQKVELAPILDHLTARPPLGLNYSEEMEHGLARVSGGLSVAVARMFNVTAPNRKNPRTEDWERAIKIFDLLL